MRLFFLLLLLANLALYYWHEQVVDWLAARAPVERPVASAYEGAPSLILLSERAEPEIAPPEIAPPEIAASPPRCLLAGPFDDRAIAEEARAAAEEAGFKVDIEQSEREVIVKYLLSLPQRYSAEEAARIIKDLKAKGIQDVATVAAGDRFAVALGIYNRARVMVKRRQQLIAAGYTPEVKERRAQRAVFSLVIEYGESDSDRLESLRKTVESLEGPVEWSETGCR